MNYLNKEFKTKKGSKYLGIDIVRLALNHNKGIGAMSRNMDLNLLPNDITGLKIEVDAMLMKVSEEIR